MAYNEFLGKVTKFGGDSARTTGVTGENVEGGPIRPPPIQDRVNHCVEKKTLNKE